MRVDLLEPLGATIREIELSRLEPGTVAALRSLLANRGVLVFPEQDLDNLGFRAFLQAFGPLAFTEGETPLPGFPDLNLVSNVGRAAPPRSNFHVDTSYVADPPAYTSLLAVEIPAAGGETLFSNQYRAFETLPPELRQRLSGRTITHVVTGVDLGEDDERSAEHPIFRHHPLCGRVALYLTTAKRCAAISGLDAAEAEEVVARLLDHSTREENLYRHRWAPGDVVIWDNGCVLHRADHSRVTGDRVMHRGMVAGYGNTEKEERWHSTRESSAA